MDAQHVDVAALLAERDDGVLCSSTSRLQSNVVALPAGLVVVTAHRARPPFLPGRREPS